MTTPSQLSWQDDDGVPTEDQFHPEAERKMPELEKLAPITGIRWIAAGQGGVKLQVSWSTTQLGMSWHDVAVVDQDGNQMSKYVIMS